MGSTSAHDRPSDAPRPWWSHLGTGVGFFVGTLLWRWITHVAGWQQHTVGESLVFATLLAVVATMGAIVWDRVRARRRGA